MLELPTQTRPLFAPGMRHNPVETEAGQGGAHRPPTEEAPLPEPARSATADLQPAPLPKPAPAAEARDRETDRDAEGVIPEDLPGSTARLVGAMPAPPTRLDAMSLFQGMLAEATRSGANVPGTSMHIYALVRQLSQLVQTEMEFAA